MSTQSRHASFHRKRRLIVALLIALNPFSARAGDLPASLVRIDENGTSIVAVPSGTGPVWISDSGDITPPANAADPERVIIQLRGTPLARTVGSRRATASALAAQRQRAAATIIQAVALSGAPAAGGAIIEREYAMVFHGFAARIPAAARARVLALPDVEAIHPDGRLTTSLVDSVPLIGAPTVWTSSGTRGAGERIAVLDTGIDYNHVDLGGCLGIGCKVVDGYDVVNNDADPLDDNGHGTHVAAAAAGSGALDGVAPDASLLAYKVCDAGGQCSSSDVIAGIERAVDPNQDTDPSDHVDIINISISGPGDADDPTSQAVDSATAVGVFVTVAAGNNGLYFTVGSPGTARTALTVGATTKTDQIAGFSSRGPSAPDYDVKPEIVAPGASICAAKASGSTLGPDCIDATHMNLSGTSMATPHVAGAAALLKAARPTLSPAELKSLLVQSSLGLLGGAFKVGAGRLDLPAAAAAQTAIEPAAVSFGLDDLSLATWTPSVAITVTNLAAVARSYTLAIGGFPLPAGAILNPSPASFSLAPGQSQLVSLQLTVDNTLVPNPLNEPFAYDQMVLTVTAGAEVSRVPVAFLKTPHLQLLFDEIPSRVFLHNQGAFTKLLAPTATMLDVLVPDGTYDVFATFSTGTVIHENIVVSGFTQHTMLSSEAVYTVSFDPRDENDAPLPANVMGFTVRHHASGNGDTVLGAGFFSMVLSSVSSAYDVTFGSLGRVGTRRYLVFDGSAGLAASHVFRNTAATVSANVMHYHQRPSETPSEEQVFFQFSPTPFLAVGIYSQLAWPGTDLQLYTSPAPFHPTPFFLQERVVDSMSQVLHTSGFMRGGTTPGVTEVYNLGDPDAPTYRTSTGELPLNLAPPHFSRRFNNQSGQVFWQQPLGGTCFSFNTQAGDGPEAGLIPWTLHAGNVVVNNGNAAQTALGCDELPPHFPPVLVPNASYRFTIGDLGYFVAGQAGDTRATAWFDNGLADPNPPAIAGLELRAGGLLTDVTDPATPMVVTLMLVDTALTNVSIAYDDGSGYTQAPVAPAGPGVYSATIPTCQPGGVSLLVTATDASGNHVQQEMNPGYLCRPGACGNGVTDVGEACDDGNTFSGDGCNATCTSNETCGNGIADFALEACDDGGTANGDGCSATCAIEPQYVCSGTPSTCTPQCGDGTILNPESCDDGDPVGGDGCSATCAIETGWVCSGQPSICTPICGDGLVLGTEACDDGGTANGDGCSASCVPENGWSCAGQPSTCAPVCGDGLVIGSEDCDDGNLMSGDCCPANCQLPTACANPGKSVIVLKDSATPGADKLIWKWLRGTSTLADIGDPTTTTSYHLCVWDDGRFVYDATLASVGQWRALGAPGSFKYLNPNGNSDGVTKALLKAGTGKSKILWKEKGSNLTLPGPQTFPGYFNQTANVTVRLMRSDGTACWESLYPTNKRNTQRTFKAKLP